MEPTIEAVTLPGGGVLQVIMTVDLGQLLIAGLLLFGIAYMVASRLFDRIRGVL